MSPSLSDNLAHLVGAWNLLSFDFFEPGSDETEPTFKVHGDKPSGQMLFTDFGYMSATLIGGAKPWESADWGSAGNKDMLLVSQGIIVYAGNYKLTEGEGGVLRVTTQVMTTMIEEWIGAEQERDISFHSEGGKSFLTLRPVQTVVMPYGLKAKVKLVWEKLPSTSVI